MLFQVSLVFFGLILILNIFEEMNYIKDLNVNLFYPLLLTTLNSPSILYTIFPFIFLVATQFFFLRIDEKNELTLFKHSSLTNFDLIKIISLVSLFLGIIIITLFYHFSAKLKHMHLNIKNKFSDDNKYLAVITENGLWIKDEINNTTNLINATKIDDNLLIDVSITQFDEKFQLIRNIETQEADISKNHWKIKSAIVSEVGFEEKKMENIIFKTNFNLEKINSLFSNLSSLTLFELNKLKKDYQTLGYSTLEVDTHKLKVFSYPLYLMVMSVFSSIIMLNIKRNKPKIFNLILGILLSVMIYYINYFSNLLGESEKLPITISVYMPLIILVLFSGIGLVRINEK
tara:strand:+ start:177 stop:1211 length:1035 start_codon:yes stop_codon:yes gene_type:complete